MSDETLALIDEIVEAGDARAASRLHRMLLDSHAEVRVAAAEALGEVADSKTVAQLVRALDDREPLVRVQAAESLGRLGAKEAAASLRSLLNDKNELVRGFAAEALGDVGDQRSIRSLVRRLDLEKRNAARVRIVAGLYKLGERKRLRDLMRFLNIRNYRVRCAASNILDEVADESTCVEIVHALRVQLARERTVAVRSTLEDCIHSIEERFPSVRTSRP